VAPVINVVQVGVIFAQKSFFAVLEAIRANPMNWFATSHRFLQDIGIRPGTDANLIAFEQSVSIRMTRLSARLAASSWTPLFRRDRPEANARIATGDRFRSPLGTSGVDTGRASMSVRSFAVRAGDSCAVMVSPRSILRRIERTAMAAIRYPSRDQGPARGAEPGDRLASNSCTIGQRDLLVARAPDGSLGC